MTFVAAFPGLCDRCDGAVRVGEELTYEGSGYARRLVHVSCPPPPTPRGVCPSCFIELPVSGVCEECA